MQAVRIFLQDMRGIIEVARESAYQAVNVALVQRNGLLGQNRARNMYPYLRGNRRNMQLLWSVSG